jgi:hypothetical protein
MFKPQLFIGLLPLLLLDRRWRALMSFSIVSGLIGGLTLWLGGIAILEDWVLLLRSDVYHNEIARQVTKMYSWQSVWTILLGTGMVTTVLSTTTALLIFTALCYVWWRRLGDLALRYALTVCGLMVMGPHLFVYDLALLVLPGLILTDHLLRLPQQEHLALRVSLFALYVLALFAANVSLPASLVLVPLITLVAFLGMQLLTFRRLPPNQGSSVSSLLTVHDA